MNFMDNLFTRALSTPKLTYIPKLMDRSFTMPIPSPGDPLNPPRRFDDPQDARSYLATCVARGDASAIREQRGALARTLGDFEVKVAILDAFLRGSTAFPL